jgi:hypothetical protein
MKKGKGEIRTHGTKSTSVFKTDAINRSTTNPKIFGIMRFEHITSCSQNRRASQLCHIPIFRLITRFEPVLMRYELTALPIKLYRPSSQPNTGLEPITFCLQNKCSTN